MKRRAAAGVTGVAVAFVALVPFAGVQTGSAAQAAEGSGASITKTVTRSHLVDGKQVTVDTRTVTVTVDQTRDLRSRQPVSVTWTGARPTGNPQADTNSPLGVNDEYPFVLLQCRGVDSPSAPAAQRLTPQTCWTQTGPQERFLQTPSTSFPAWRVDQAAPPSERAFHVGDPSPLPKGCDPGSFYATRRLPFVAKDGTRYYPDGGLCTEQPPESLVVDNTSQPGNTTYGITRLDGRGDTKFTVWTSQDNASLGCAQGVACALVAVPVMGIGCDAAGEKVPAADRPPDAKVDQVAKDCQSAGNYQPGEPFNGSQPALAVSGRLWWSASNWANRITVPLTFAPADDVCDVVGGRAGVDLYGSELMTQAMIQWRPAFCLDKARTPFRHVQVGEPQAASLLAQRSIEAALVSDAPPGGFGSGVATAPVAFTGFGVVYAIDDEKGARYTKLRLNARLLAKLLTMSYPAQNFVRDEWATTGPTAATDTEPATPDYRPLKDNPIDMSLDPEFQALNPGIKRGVGNSAAASTILSLSSDSDVIRAVTTYIDTDPEARAWLDGAPDPWGMRVNPSYSKLDLPVQTWPQLDSFEPKRYYATGLNPCLQTSPVPYLPLVASPTIRMSNISFALQFANASSQITCVEAAPGSTDGLKLVASGRQSPGFRFVLGITSLGDAARYDLDTAALQTAVDDGATGAFTDGSGRTFVKPDAAGLKAAAALVQRDQSTGTWSVPLARVLSGTGEGASAYPGALVVSAAVSTTGLSSSDASAFAAFVRWAVTTGQRPGTTNGTLPSGYLPMTAANNLGQLVAAAQQAAQTISRTSSTGPTSGGGTGGTPGNGAPNGTGGAPGPGAPGTPGTPGSPGTGITPPRSTPPAPTATTPGQKTATMATVAQPIGVAGWVVPLLLLGALGGALSSVGSAVWPRLRGRRG